MILSFHQPAAPLDTHVELMTYYAGWMPDHSIERLMPDGASYLIIELDDLPKFIYCNETLQARQKCTHSWVSGMHSHFLSISAVQHSSMFVIRFQPGGGYPILGIPLYELDNQVIDAELIFGEAVTELREQLLAASDPNHKFAVAARWLKARVNKESISEKVVRYAVDTISANPTSSNLLEIAKKSGYSQKQFIQLFKKHVGLTPKRFQRILRFNRALLEIELHQEVCWNNLSYECGYYDQAHFIRDFKDFAGFNPEAFLRQQRTYTNYVTIR